MTMANLKYRNKLQVYSEILTNTLTPRKRGRLLGLVGLSSRYLTVYIDTLIKADLLLALDDGTFKTTIKGEKYIAKFKELSEFIPMEIVA